jgi:ketosteroid isomerase-like protein
MSQENVERFVAGMAAFNQIARSIDEAADLQGFLAGLDSQIQFYPQQAALEGAYAGHEGVMQWLADLAESYQDGHLRFAEIRDLGDQVLGLGTLHFTARASGIETDLPVAIVARFRNGLMTQFRDYGDRRMALEAVGLAE